MKTKRTSFKLKTRYVCVFLLTFMILSTIIGLNKPTTSVNATTIPEKFYQSKSILLIYGGQTIIANGIDKNGLIVDSTSGKSYAWYNREYLNFITAKKTHSHNYQAVSTSEYMLECDTCGQKSFDYEYLSSNWQKIKGVKERLDSSMVIVYIPDSE